MRVAVIYCHPCEESFNAAIRDRVVESLSRAGNEVRLVDLYASGFDPIMSGDERRSYHDASCNENPVSDHLEHIRWAQGLVFLYPTWWFGLPAMLKGWLDRVWVPHATFSMPEGKGPLKGEMVNIKRIAVVTTCGASWIVSKYVGEPGRRTILRGLRNICCPNCRTLYLALYKMDTSTPASRENFMSKVGVSLPSFFQ